MARFVVIVCVSLLSITGCSRSKNLTKEEALKILQGEVYSKPFECSMPTKYSSNTDRWEVNSGEGDKVFCGHGLAQLGNIEFKCTEQVAANKACPKYIGRPLKPAKKQGDVAKIPCAHFKETKILAVFTKDREATVDVQETIEFGQKIFQLKQCFVSEDFDGIRDLHKSRKVSYKITSDDSGNWHLKD